MGTGNCFNLVGDGDDVVVLTSVERAFGVRISEAEAESCEAFGQLFDVVWGKVQGPDQIGLKCPAAIAFFTLRGALRRCGFVGRITPASDLKEFFRQRGAKRLRKQLAAEAGLELPDLVLTTFSTAGLLLSLVAGAVVAVAQSSWLPLLASAMLAAGFVIFDPKQLPDKIASMRDFTSACTAWNYGVLARKSGGARSRDVWSALAIVVRESCDTGFNGTIDRETRFFPSNK